jgi:phage tail sheath protein FI
MMIYLRKVILASTQRLVFEPNDRFTWARVEELINPLLGDISRRRGITEFSVTCDETTNTPLRVDRNEMWCKVLIKPTKTAEMVVFELNLTSQSASI